jgi:hypothetical protein
MVRARDRSLLGRAAVVVSVAIVTGGALARTAHAQAPAADADRVSARQLGEEGKRLFEAGDFAGALDRFQRADALVRRHTLGVRIARCLVKLGRLTEALDRYVAVSRMELPAGVEPGILAVQKDALAEAEAEGAALARRIPSVVIEVRGASEPVVVTVDGAVVPAALLGAKRAVDPGAHKIAAASAGRQAAREVSVREGESVPVTLTFAADHDEGSRPTVPLMPAAPSPPPAQRNAAIASLAIGAGGLALGAITGALAVAKKSALDAPCGANLQCPLASWSDADAYNRLRTASTIGFAAGAGVAALGGVLLLTAPRAPVPAAALWISPRGAGVGVAFR